MDVNHSYSHNSVNHDSSFEYYVYFVAVTLDAAHRCKSYLHILSLPLSWTHNDHISEITYTIVHVLFLFLSISLVNQL